jgi:amino acid adenylation domain-containing protein
MSMRDTVVGRFARAAAAAPSAEALRCGGVRLTFADVEGRASTLAAMLRRQGVPAGGVVGLLLGRSAAAIVAVLACWKAGIAYCPLSESDPPDRLARLCAELGLAAVLAAPETVTALPVPVLVIDGAAAGLAAADPFDGPPPDEEDLAYVMFTSGSTGVPLAVEVTHANCRYLDDALASLYDRVLPPGRTRVGVNAPLTFDSSVKQLLQLTRGRTLCVLTGPERADPVTFMAAVARYGIEVLDITPSHLRLLLATDPALRGLEGVWLLVGGEAMTGQLCAALSASRIAGFANVYGPTECTVNATAATAGEAPAIGRPLPGAEVFVVDGRGRPRGEGESGELVIAGAGVSRGYANSPSATARRFVVLPSLPGSPRCFRTGDVGVWRDGLLWFLGRRDDQVKVGGRRLHLIEVERQVIEATGALEAAVVLDDGDPPALVAVVGVPDGAAPAPADLLDRLRERLAPWMVPRRCVVLERLPRNRNGKVSREALTALLAEPDRAPAGEGPVDDAVAAEFARVLGVASVPPEADFFEQGGDSLSALRLLRGLERRLGRRVDVASFFERPSVAGLVSAIRAAGG